MANITGVADSELLNGTSGDDTITTGGGNDTVAAFGGNDSIEAGSGSDSILGADGNDTITLISWGDIADGGAGNDSLVGTDYSAEQLLGGDGNDTIIGGSKGVMADTINGGAGNDSIEASTGIVDGGDGYDTLKIEAQNIFVYSAIYYTTPTATFDYASSFDAIHAAIANGDTFQLTYGYYGQQLQYSNIEKLQIYTWAGGGLFLATEGNEYYGMSDYDAAYIDWSSYTTGITWTNLSTTVQVINNVTFYDIDRFILKTGSGDDFINNSINYAGDDIQTGEGADTVIAGDGRDNISGGAGNDSISANSGDDTLQGGAGLNTLTGGWGADFFVLDSNGFATITDYNLYEDYLDLRSISFSNITIDNLLSSGHIILTDTDGGVLVSVDSDGGGDNLQQLALLQNITASQIYSSHLYTATGPDAVDDTAPTATEGGAIVTGSLASNDTDPSPQAQLTYGLANIYAGLAGLDIHTDGTYTFDPTAYKEIAEGATASWSIRYQVTDGMGYVDYAYLNINVLGINHAPSAYADTAIAVAGGGVISGDLYLNDIDPDSNWYHRLATYSVISSVDGFTLQTNGIYEYSPVGYDYLADGETADVVVTYVMTDEYGATSSSTLTVTVTGANDTPIALSDVNVALEDAVVSGILASNDTDADADSVLTYTLLTSMDGLGLSANGAYSFNPSSSSYQALKAGDTTVVEATYSVTDQYGASSNATLTITVTGSNDLPIANAETGAVAELGVSIGGNTVFAGVSLVTGNFLSNDVDVDSGDVLTLASVNGVSAQLAGVVTGTYGALSISSTGAYTYTLNNADTDTNSLARGATATEQFTYTVTDTTGGTSSATLTLTITGSNDAPIAIADTSSVKESGVTGTNTAVAGVLTATGNALSNDTDVDTGENKTLSSISFGANAGVLGSALTGTYGSLVINSAGVYTYTLNNADTDTNALAQGQTATDVFTYSMFDTYGATSVTTLTITVTGTNDTPLAVADTASVTESGVTGANTAVAGVVTAVGTVLTNDTDVDTGDTKTVTAINIGATAGTLSTALTGTYGSLVLNSAGVYTYTLNNADTDTNALAQGQTATEVFTYSMRDTAGATSVTTLTITVTGTNDTPVAVADIANATEGGSNVTGTLSSNDSDVDSGAALTYTLSNTVAGLSLSTTGVYTFNPSNTAYDSLAAGTSTTVVGTYVVTDGQGAVSVTTLTITVTGTNDAPIANADTASSTEGGAGVTGNVSTNDSDVDAGTTLTYSLSNSVAGLTLSSTGAYTFDPSNSAYDSLAAGTSTTMIATYAVTDGQGGTSTTTLTITVTGTNDTPVAVADTVGSTEDGSIITGNVGANDTDVDANAALTFSLNNSVEGLSLGSTGTYCFDPSSYDSLGAGQTTQVVGSYTVTDEYGASSINTLTITVTGTNDAPIANLDSASATEDGAIITGNVRDNDSDVDMGAQLTYSLLSSLEGLTLNTDGTYSFDPASYDTLIEGEVGDFVATIQVSDEFGATAISNLTLSVTGVNDLVIQTGSFADLLMPLNSALDIALIDAFEVTGETLSLSVTRTNGTLPSWISLQNGHLVGNSGLNSGIYKLELTAIGGLSTLVNDFTITVPLAGATDLADKNLRGTDGDDYIDGLLGADTMLAGLGDDVYVIDNKGDVVTEGLSAGLDEVQSSVNYALFKNIENLVLLGTGNLKGTGNILDNEITGNEGANSLSGGAGNDTLIGGAGNDTLAGNAQEDFYYGGSGDDLFVINDLVETNSNGLEHIIELANQGFDTLQFDVDNASATALSYTLAANIEKLSVTGTGLINITANSENNYVLGNGTQNQLDGGLGNDTLIGAAGNDGLLGSSGDDSLEGGLGRDTMTGGIGNDSYSVNTSFDVIFESAGGGLDIVYSFSSDFTLAADQEIEQLVIVKGAGKATGNGLDNTLTGNASTNTLNGLDGNDTLAGGAAADKLDGGAGDDLIQGGAGYDILTGGAGNDIFLLDTALKANFDTIKDFTTGEDKIELDSTLFTALHGMTSLSSANFSSGSGVKTASAADNYLIYDTKTGKLYYDADGDGIGSKAVQIATLSKAVSSLTAPDLSFDDFIVI